MAPTYIKGGVWTNVEDEILRASISKYGLNQWARVSSLLSRKTAKQVKARWMEWLDPSIKKIEWSREEDEKLLHLAKLLPTQWRTIAPIVGRTATQCIERYQKLLDDAEQREAQDLGLAGIGSDAAAPLGEVRKLRLGDIDPTPEAKPARPDAIDMDEDEKEMLSEARARLANTQGKKAKRKDRERLLEESRRLALLQKRRELKQAGISTKLHKRARNQVDYNADIPFEHKPAAGFYDVSEEAQSNEQAREKFGELTRKKGIVKNEDKDKKDDRKRDRDESKESAAQQAANAARAEKIQRLNQQEQLSKRRKLVLPAPQVRDEELEQIVKYGNRSDQVKDKYSDDTITGSLVGDYSQKVLGEPLRTPQAPREESTIFRATRDIRNLTNTQSALLGEENTPLHESAFSARSILPPPKISQTPNPLAMRTPVGGISQTPRRDGLGVNLAGVGATPREILRSNLKSLPKPKNDFEIVLPEGPEEQAALSVPETDLVEDAGEKERQAAKERELRAQKELEGRSSALKKGLPRPSLKGPKSHKEFPTGFSDAAKLVEEEALNLVRSDQARYPTDKSNGNGTSKLETIADIPDDIKAKCEDLVKKEVESLGDIQAFQVGLLQKRDHDVPSLPGLEAYADELPEVSDILTTELSKVAQKSGKLEKKLGLVLGGYVKRQGFLSTKLSEAYDALVQSGIDRKSYEQLRDIEETSISSRLASLQDEANFLAEAERRGQEKFRDLQALKASLSNNV